MNVQRGDVVLLRAAFTGGAGTKIRPMLVVQNDGNNVRMTNTILVVITTNLSRISETTQVLVDINSPEGQGSGLKRNSAVSCENILTVLQGDILRLIGHLPDSLMQRVDIALKASLALT